MGEFFGTIYCWFELLFGLPVADYLWGTLTDQQTSNLFIPIGLSMMGITLLFTLLYYNLIDTPRLNSWWGWGLFGLGGAVVNFIVGWQWLRVHWVSGWMTIPDSAIQISENDICLFGLANAFLSLFFFVVFSLLLKWKSTNCANSPF